MAASLRIGRVFGVPIYLHFTFLIILPLFVWLFSESDQKILWFTAGFGGLDAPQWEKYAFGTAASVIFFLTILVHELAHSYLALRYGVRIKSITLMLFGGVAAMEEMPKEPRQELKMAFAGPASSLAIGGASLAGMLLIDSLHVHAVFLDGLSILFGLMAFYNILLAGFNMLPAFPMDGGRVLRAYLATRMSHIDATRKAARTGRFMAIAMGVFGLLTGNIWLIFIAFFVYIGATEEERATAITDSLEGLKVANIMAHPVEVVHPDTTVQQLLDLMFATRHMGFPVTDGRLVGIVTLSDAHRVPRDQAQYARVGHIMTREVATVGPDTGAAEALKIMTARGIGRLVVLDRGSIVGIVTRKDLLRAADVVDARRRGRHAAYPPPPPGQPPYAPPPSPPAASS
jgi:Zn-dependent protease